MGVIRTAGRIHEAGAAQAVAAGVPITSADELDDATLADIARSSALVVDGILGIGTTDSPALRGEGRRVVAALLPVVTAEGGPAVIACDTRAASAATTARCRIPPCCPPTSRSRSARERPA